MNGYFINSSHETVRYKNIKNESDEEHNAEILITPSNEGGKHTQTEKIFPKLKIYLYLFIFLIPLTIIVTICALYYENSAQNVHSTEKLNYSFNSSCVSPHLIGKVIYRTETTSDLKGCSDNKTCHSFLDAINQDHDGSKYNFVIGPRGELYIGSGFKCLINSKENVLNVKVLSHPLSRKDYFRSCYRLSEIIDHGILCEKISPNYTSALSFDNGNIIEGDIVKVCSKFVSPGKNRAYHVHDPGHEMLLVQENFGWSYCGNFSSTLNIKENRVITMDILREITCQSLKLIDQITVDIELTPPIKCSNVPSCLHTFEEHHDGLRYNFIISHNMDLYIGLGFKCRAENTFNNVLKVKVLNLPGQSDHIASIVKVKFFLIVEEGIACGIISEKFSLKVNCKFAFCEQYYGDLNNADVFKRIQPILAIVYDNYNISTEHGRGIVPNEFRYQYCHRNNSQDTPVTIPNSNIEINTYPVSSCNPIQEYKTVQIETEKIEKTCSLNCLSLQVIIEQEHNGSNYNFVIGPRGELYIGSGFKCTVNNAENTFKVKLLIKEDSPEEKSHLCSRLLEIINHGTLCEKIHKDYAVEFSDNNVCANFELDKQRTNHEHDPDQTRKLIPENTGWTFCGDFSSRINDEKDKVITMKSYLETCLPLHFINQVNVDVVETSPFNCIDNSSCMEFFEKDQNGLKYNFIIGHNQEVYFSLGFKCRVENVFENVLKIKVLIPPYTLYGFGRSVGQRYLQILHEGISCGRINREFSVEANCGTDQTDEVEYCKESFERFLDKETIEIWLDEDYEKSYYISSEHIRGIVPREYKLQICPTTNPQDTLTPIWEGETDLPTTMEPVTPQSQNYDDHYSYTIDEYEYE